MGFSNMALQCIATCIPVTALVNLVQEYDVSHCALTLIAHWPQDRQYEWPDHQQRQVITAYLWKHHLNDVVVPWVHARMLQCLAQIRDGKTYSSRNVFVSFSGNKTVNWKIYPKASYWTSPDTNFIQDTLLMFHDLHATKLVVCLCGALLPTDTLTLDLSPLFTCQEVTEDEQYSVFQLDPAVFLEYNDT